MGGRRYVPPTLLPREVLPVEGERAECEVAPLKRLIERWDGCTEGVERRAFMGRWARSGPLEMIRRQSPVGEDGGDKEEGRNGGVEVVITERRKVGRPSLRAGLRSSK
jgi:hypothetical protein